MRRRQQHCPSAPGPAPAAALTVLAAFTAAAFTACAAPARDTVPPPPSPATPSPSAPAAEPPPTADVYGPAPVASAALAKLLDEHWDWRMEREPVRATTLGDHRFDDRLPAIAHGYVLDEQRARRGFLERARALGEGELSPSDRLTVDMFVELLEGRIGIEPCQLHLWSVSVRDNPISWANRLPQKHKIEGAEDAAKLLVRYRTLARYINDVTANLRRGLAAGKVADAEAVRRTLALVDGQLDTPLVRWTLLDPIRDLDRHTSWPADDRYRFGEELEAVVVDWIKPAFYRYRDLLRDEILPKARTGEHAGVGSLPDGWACYRALVRHHIGMDRNPLDIHRLGQEEIARINAEMVDLGERLFGTRDLGAIVTRLRTDPGLYFERSEDVLEAARTALAAAEREMSSYFGILPRADCVVAPIPAYEAPFTTIAYYNGPFADGAKPGEYFINTYKPEVRPRFEMQVLAYHEAIPGHHLQIAIAQERTELPAFRRHEGSTAFVEGWALYTERLSDEMGLYSGDLDRMGMLSYDAWRASRLVVDTGIHALGWTREQAETFLREHTALTEENISNEVDRYITTPGQAVAYKVGQLAIRGLRAEAEAALGPDFDIKRFHDVVLRNGAITLPALEQVAKTWIARQAYERAQRATAAE
ncbi:DUF885 domain-containing protein [Haliangium sp.]|uniref:DUF885 domain-containing protein n=1 Tax=Haliangium sp. TaxID=2663208 RepID=UPI003D0B759F